MKKSFTLFFFILFIFTFISFAENNDPYLDKKLAEKYGLKVPPPLEKIESAPDWVLNMDMIIHSGDIWSGFKTKTKVVKVIRNAIGRNGEPIKIEGAYLKRIVIDGKFDGSAIKGVPLISHIPHSKAAFKQAHEQGFRVTPYVHFLDIRVNLIDQDVALIQHPEIILKDNEGHIKHTPMDGTYRLHRVLVCANSPSYWKLSLKYVKKLMDWGADGVFVDNVHSRRDPCMAPKFNEKYDTKGDIYPGYRPWQHPSLEPFHILYNPEFGRYKHEHLFPNATHDYAFERFLNAIRVLVKSYGKDKIVILNSGVQTPFQKYGDISMWESFIYSWAWKGRGATWEDVKKFAKDNEYFTSRGKRITGLSYLDKNSKTVKEDAFWAFVNARLVDIIWWSYLKDTGAEALYRVHLGKPSGKFVENGKLVYRVFSDGIIVLNNSLYPKKISFVVPAQFKHKKLYNIFNKNKRVSLRGKKFKFHMPANSGRVFYFKPL